MSVARRSHSNPFVPEWVPLGTPPPLLPGSLHIWKIGSGHSFGIDLPDRERDRVASRLDPDDRELAQTALEARRYFGSQYEECSPSGIAFESEPGGKPSIVNGRTRFNLSHSGNYLLIAFARDADVGIDIELIRPRNHLDSLCRRFLPDCASNRIHSAADPLTAFHYEWTQMEAVLKAGGMGLAKGLEGFRRNPVEAFTFAPEVGYAAAIFSIPGNLSLQFFRLKGSSLRAT